MIIFYIYLIISIVDIVMFTLITRNGVEEFKRRYPGYTVRRLTSTEKLLSTVRIVLVSFCPILNILLAWVLIVKTEELTDGCIKDVLKKAYREDEQAEN